jgi:Luciferase-like monooxygenase
MPRLAAGHAKSGRRRQNFEISGGGFLATGPDEATVARMFEWVRQRVGFYGSTPAYYPVLAAHGLEDLGHKLNALARQGRWDEMTKEVPDDVVHLFAAVGRWDEIAKAIDERFGGLADAINARGNPATPALPRELIADIRRLPCAFKGFAIA